METFRIPGFAVIAARFTLELVGPLWPHFGGILGRYGFFRTISQPSLGKVGRLHWRRRHRLLKDHKAGTLSFGRVCRGSPRDLQTYPTRRS